MKASKELRQWINRLRRHSGKKNGVVKWMGETCVPLMMETSKKNALRTRTSKEVEQLDEQD
jgi:hypothetical protein